MEEVPPEAASARRRIYLIHVDVQHAFAREDRLAAAEAHRPDHREQQEKADELHHDERADHGQHHLDKIFHAFEFVMNNKYKQFSTKSRIFVFDKTIQT